MVQYRIPNFLNLLKPYIKPINPNFDVVEAEGVAWIDASSLSKAQKMELKDGGLAYFLARIYPTSSVGSLHVAHDYLTYTLLNDIMTDIATPSEARKWADLVTKAFGQTLGEVEGPAAIVNLADKVMNAIEEPYRDCLIKYTSFLTEGVVQEAVDRENSHITVERYLQTRRYSVGVLPFLAIGRWMRKLDISPEVLKHPGILKLEEQTVDLVFLANDLYSYKKEFIAGGALHNYVSVALGDFSTGLHEKDRQGAIDFTYYKFSEILADFQRRKETLPSFGETEDAKIALYTDVMMDILVGNIHYSLVVPRYGHNKGGTLVLDGPNWEDVIFDMDPL